MKTRLAYLGSFLLICSFVHAQIEVAHLNSKGYSATGVGTFLNVGLPISKSTSITAEAGLYYFNQNDDHISLIPFLVGYRHTFNGSGTGLYVEPTAGHSIGATNIQKYNEYETRLPDGEGGRLENKVKGLTAGLGIGYIFTEKMAFNIGLRHQCVFVSEGPALSLFSLRLSYPFSLGKRK